MGGQIIALRISRGGGAAGWDAGAYADTIMFM